MNGKAFGIQLKMSIQEIIRRGDKWLEEELIRAGFDIKKDICRFDNIMTGEVVFQQKQVSE